MSNVFGMVNFIANHVGWKTDNLLCDFIVDFFVFFNCEESRWCLDAFEHVFVAVIVFLGLEEEAGKKVDFFL
jgi:hypothetical protein